MKSFFTLDINKSVLEHNNCSVMLKVTYITPGPEGESRNYIRKLSWRSLRSHHRLPSQRFWREVRAATKFGQSETPLQRIPFLPLPKCNQLVSCFMPHLFNRLALIYFLTHSLLMKKYSDLENINFEILEEISVLGYLSRKIVLPLFKRLRIEVKNKAAALVWTVWYKLMVFHLLNRITDIA